MIVLNPDHFGFVSSSSNNMYISDNSSLFLKATVSFNGSQNNKASGVQARMLLSLIFCPIIIVVGTIGNTLSFFTMRRSKLRAQATGIYLAVLAIYDTGALWSGLLRHYLLYGFGNEIRATTWICKIHIFLTYYFMHVASVLLAAVGFQRYIFVCFPGRCIWISSKKGTYWIIAAVSMFVAISEIHYLLFYVVTHHPIKDERGCTVDPDRNPKYYYWRESIIGLVQLATFYIIPFVILLISNVGIINSIVTSGRKMMLQGRSQSKRTAVSAIMIVISVYFIMLTMPAQTYLSLIMYVETRKTFLLEWTVITLIYYTNHASNFVLYILTGQAFRKELFMMLRSFGLMKATNEHSATSME